MTEIDWKFHKKQNETLEALNSDFDLVCFRTGYGGGKSVLGARWVIEKSLEYSRTDNLVLAVDRQKGKASTFQVFFKQLPPDDVNTNPDMGGDPEDSPIIKSFNASDLRLTTITNSSIRLGSADKWNRYAGAEFSTIWCDEPSHYDTTDLYKLYEILLSRQRSKKGSNKMLWTSTGAGFNQFYDITEKKIDKEGEPLNWADNMKVVVGSSRDNPWLEELDKLERAFGGTSMEKQAIEGGFAAPQGLVYKRFGRDTHVVNKEDYELKDNFYLYGYDHGWNDPRVFLEIRKTSYDQYIVVDEFYKRETTIEDGIEWLEEKPKGKIYAEHEPEHQEKFKRVGHEVEKAKKDLDEGIDFVREYLRADDDGKVGLLVDQKCRNTIQEFLGYTEEQVGKSSARDHSLDALRYALFTHENTIDREGWGFALGDDW